MKHLSFIFLCFSAIVIITGTNCKKNNPEAGLPPATQEGKNTCGFLVNGKIWTPRGDNGYPNLSCSYDETYNGGTLGLSGYRYENNSTTSTHFVVGGNNLSSVGIYKLNLSSNQEGRYSIAIRPTGSCFYEWYDTVPNHNAFLNITKLDKVNRIVSGTFEFALVKPGCDTIRITKGRFDMKF